MLSTGGFAPAGTKRRSQGQRTSWFDPRLQHPKIRTYSEKCWGRFLPPCCLLFPIFNQGFVLQTLRSNTNFPQAGGIQFQSTGHLATLIDPFTLETFKISNGVQNLSHRSVRTSNASSQIICWCGLGHMRPPVSHRQSMQLHRRQANSFDMLQPLRCSKDVGIAPAVFVGTPLVHILLIPDIGLPQRPSAVFTSDHFWSVTSYSGSILSVLIWLAGISSHEATPEDHFSERRVNVVSCTVT